MRKCSKSSGALVLLTEAWFRAFSLLSLDFLFSPDQEVGRIGGEADDYDTGPLLRGPESEEVSMGGECGRWVWR